MKNKKMMAAVLLLGSSLYANSPVEVHFFPLVVEFFVPFGDFFGFNDKNVQGNYVSESSTSRQLADDVVMQIIDRVCFQGDTKASEHNKRVFFSDPKSSVDLLTINLCGKSLGAQNIEDLALNVFDSYVSANVVKFASAQNQEKEIDFEMLNSVFNSMFQNSPFSYGTLVIPGFSGFKINFSYNKDTNMSHYSVSFDGHERLIKMDGDFFDASVPAAEKQDFFERARAITRANLFMVAPPVAVQEESIESEVVTETPVITDFQEQPTEVSSVEVIQE
jgi:hypothetical protein